MNKKIIWTENDQKRLDELTLQRIGDKHLGLPIFDEYTLLLARSELFKLQNPKKN